MGSVSLLFGTICKVTLTDNKRQQIGSSSLLLFITLKGSHGVVQDCVFQGLYRRVIYTH